MTNTAQIRNITLRLLAESFAKQVELVERVIAASEKQIEDWPGSGPMILPKNIASAILAHESGQYDGKGTSYEKSSKKEIERIKLIL